MPAALDATRHMPVVSVIIPAHNSAAFIADAIAGVRAQTFTDHEIIVVDDGSTDDTDEVIRRFPEVRSVRQSNHGVAAARNAGIALARGEFVCFLDADDLWRPQKLARQLHFMAAHPDVGLLFTDAEEHGADVVEKASILATMTCGGAATRVPIEDAFRKLLIENFIPTSTVMVRRSCLTASGPFDISLPNVEDRDMWLRLAAVVPVACLPEVTACKRSHGANISMRTELTLRSRIQVWQKARQRFPALAPAAVYEGLLAPTYQQLGYVVLARGERREARRCAAASIASAARCILSRASLSSYRWRLSFALLALSFLRGPWVQFLWQARNVLRRKTTPAAA